MSKLVELYGKVKGHVYAIVDDEDYERVIQHKWYASPRNYVSTFSNKTKERTYLHRFILNTPPDLYTDHINRNPLDNRKSNLRTCTNSQNQANTKSWNGLDTKGVYFYKGRWVARISCNGTRKYLGRFKSKNDALAEYNRAAREFFGSFARPSNG